MQKRPKNRKLSKGIPMSIKRQRTRKRLPLKPQRLNSRLLSGEKGIKEKTKETKVKTRQRPVPL